MQGHHKDDTAANREAEVGRLPLCPDRDLERSRRGLVRMRVSAVPTPSKSVSGSRSPRVEVARRGTTRSADISHQCGTTGDFDLKIPPGTDDKPGRSELTLPNCERRVLDGGRLGSSFWHPTG